MRKLLFSLVLVAFSLFLSVAPAYAWFNWVQVPNPVQENVTQVYGFHYTADYGQYVIARGRWYDGAGYLVGGWDRDYGWFSAGQSFGPVWDFFKYDCSSQGGSGRYRVSIDGVGFTQREYSIQNNC